MNGQEELLRCDWLPNEQDGSILAALDYPMKNVSKSHIINPLWTKLVRSRWLDIGLILFSLDHSLKLKEKYEMRREKTYTFMFLPRLQRRRERVNRTYSAVFVLTSK